MKVGRKRGEVSTLNPIGYVVDSAEVPRDGGGGTRDLVEHVIWLNTFFG